MLIFHGAAAINKYLKTKRNSGMKTGFVPTMGALHEGHLSLVTHSKTNTDLTISSIFVNPTQFNDLNDYHKYPVTIESDILLLEREGCDVLFLPAVNEIYPGGTSSLPFYKLGFVETILEGYYRPGHFQGVCQVVHRLLTIVAPDELYLGQKDFQQVMVIKKMIELEALPVEIVTGQTLREPNGLAMSSRNMRLNAEERKTAVEIYQTLLMMKKNLMPGNVMLIKEQAKHHLIKKGFKPDYTELANADTLEIITDWNGKDKVIALIAAYLNEVRLIDNMMMNE